MPLATAGRRPPESSRCRKTQAQNIITKQVSAWGKHWAKLSWPLPCFTWPGASSSVALSALQSFLMYSWASQRLSALLNQGCCPSRLRRSRMSKLRGPKGNHQLDPSPTGRRTTAATDMSKCRRFFSCYWLVVVLLKGRRVFLNSTTPHNIEPRPGVSLAPTGQNTFITCNPG